MKILFDENMPYAEAFFASIGQCQPFAGRALKADDCRDADVLLVRSITQVNAELLAQAQNLKFVGTATIGVDHIDQAYLHERGIRFTSAPGCNAKSVADYVISSLLVLAQRYDWQLKDKSVAIIGAGNIGTALSSMLDALGMRYVLCDPLLAANGDERQFVDFEDALKADILTFHVPLTLEGEYATRHMINQDVLANLHDGQVLINTCRGPVFDNQALLSALSAGKCLHLVMDVWEDEPRASHALINECEIATAHIAGYSLEGKAKGTAMLYQACSAFFDMPASLKLEQFLPEYAVNHISLNGDWNQTLARSLIHSVYDVRRDDALLRNHYKMPADFDALRKSYPQRRELSALKISAGNQTQEQALYGLGFSLLK